MRSRTHSVGKKRSAHVRDGGPSEAASSSASSWVVSFLLLLSLVAIARWDASRVSQEAPRPVGAAGFDGGEFHVIFSTDCGSYQDWQSEVVYHSATLVGQPGTITRIASGCTEAEAAKLVARHALPDLAGRFLVHLTPHFSTDGESGKDYKFYNKPYGLRHWLAHAEPPLGEDAVVALIDPDFIFLRPMTADVSNSSAILASAPVDARRAARSFRRVARGRPVGQFYGLGDGWLKFDREKICGPQSPCANVTAADAWRYYSVGPPYVAHVDDLRAIAAKWCDFVPRVFAQYPELLAEMYAYSMAAAHLRLPHLRLDHYMLSNTQAYGEAWPWVDGAARSSCDESLPQRLWPHHNVPVFVHYCQGYRFPDTTANTKGHKELVFGKRRIPHDVFASCAGDRLPRPSPLDFGADHGDLRATPAPGPPGKDLRDRKRAAFMFCAATDTVNAVKAKFAHLGLRRAADGGACEP